MMYSKSVTFGDLRAAQILFGERDRNLAQIENRLRVMIVPKDRTLRIEGEDEQRVELTQNLLKNLYDHVSLGHPLLPSDIEMAIELHSRKNTSDGVVLSPYMDLLSQRGKEVLPKTAQQRRYIEACLTHDLCFSWGPAGTGKTFLAMALAVSALIKKEVDRIILTRPAVEAGEKLGFLPGALEEKVNPYLRPLFDSLHDLMDAAKIRALLLDGTIEAAPLAFMRGRTLNHAFVILDEAQNTTPDQMKMFLTRLGQGTKAIVNGDITQIDLPYGQTSGFTHAREILKGIREIAFIEFSSRDIVRSPLVERIVRAYEEEK